MGNLQCPAEDAALLASVAREICPFPNYNPSPHYMNMLFINSSLHLKNHYTEVQTSLTPKQLDDFTQGLRTTFGREGRVTLGGVGVVALSLAVLFDTLARQVRGESVSESGPIRGLFLKDPRGYYPPHAHTISEYLRLVPHIANNPSRMKEETERYVKPLRIDSKTKEEYKRMGAEDVTSINMLLEQLLESSMELHLARIANSTTETEVETKGNPVPPESTSQPRVDAAHVIKTRNRRIPPPENSVIFNLNCNPEEASKVFLAEVQKFNDTQEAFKQCHPRNRRIPKTWLHFIARLVWLDFVNNMHFDHLTNFQNHGRFLVDHREDFDLRANALKKWADE